jgi:antitoxin component HigA of HigAB toxin-antitoxin module
MSIALKHSKYAALLTRVLPEVIESDKAYKAALAEVQKLITKDVRSPEEIKLTKLLTALIVTYEKEKYPNWGNASPLDVLEHLMENKGHTAKDLWGVIGDKGTVSKVLNGHRSISKLQAKQLAKFYGVSVATFI